MQNILFPKKPKTRRMVYLDHAAATPVDLIVVKAMAPFWSANFANPSALYSLGKKNEQLILDAKKTIAKILFCQPDCITFTSGGTESNNLAIFGVIKRQINMNQKQSRQIHVITTAIEHQSVFEPIKKLEKEKVRVTYIPVNQECKISVKEIIGAIRPDTKLISIMYANNEIGTINPIAEIGRELLKYRQKNKTLFPYFQVDACQAAGTLDLHTERLHVDLMTLNASKIYGPKGAGLLFVRRGVQLEPIVYGGGQELGLRSGTANVPGIIGLAKALELVQNNFAKESMQQAQLRDYFWKKIQTRIPHVYLNGPKLNETRLANNLNVRFSGLEGETLVLYLDAYGIMAATGSACATDTSEASHVLTACGLANDEAKSSVRFTLGKTTVKQDINYVMKFLPKLVEGIRKMNTIK